MSTRRLRILDGVQGEAAVHPEQKVPLAKESARNVSGSQDVALVCQSSSVTKCHEVPS